MNTKLLTYGIAYYFRTYTILEWICPLTGEKMTERGEFDYELLIDKFIHDVYDESGTLAYTVIA